MNVTVINSVGISTLPNVHFAVLLRNSLTLGPPHIAALSEFHYVRVTSISGDSARVAIIEPDAADEDFGEGIDIALLKRRVVSDDEGALWPGAYVGHPIAFIQPDGLSMDEWAFGLITGYSMKGSVPWLHVRHAGGNCKEVVFTGLLSKFKYALRILTLIVWVSNRIVDLPFQGSRPECCR
ncbi:hypothetical protein PF005_g25465 [Phytophthora fragariae]|uniref:Uncharacterized protein n=1 Tax=Phytophthora fragariae TaxID=53985 RepID=A0A6A3RC38_9STRA|nr:hypothetical protein PF003_g17128 [Phytophthora fragariae]KAE8923827.1 hypothetical protein PF009_g25931 [Phytophthora fragariae]KAE9074823.1 hypothetical protein PF007_g25253 [Phytophthora fragariae]KAE9092685.1 hypothetical protein PF006_g24630 [Phytophthora fragariae]KAE9175283.1 hypothetical protein PF005_g25465 [Phytophthora fragariae]